MTQTTYEGKLTQIVCEETGIPKWELSEEAKEDIRKINENILIAATQAREIFFD